MSDNQNFGFGKFVPGFDFLQSLAKGASQSLPQMPNLSSWVAPTLNVEELEKRIGELKAVHFWLDQNSKALGATIQALEVQRMTLATLKGMNFNMGELADALKLKTPESMFSGTQKTSNSAAGRADTADANERDAGSQAGKADAGSQPASGADAAPSPARKKAGKAADQPAATGVVDPLQWWGALTQQFQQIAASAMKDAAAQAAVDTRNLNMPGGGAKETPKRATGAAKTATGRKTAAKHPARKTVR
jgi:hypothetical protein